MAASSRRVSWVCMVAVVVVVVVVVGAVGVVVVVVGEKLRTSGDILGLCFFLRSRQSFLAVEDHPLLCFL